jgi:hypothetical protein
LTGFGTPDRPRTIDGHSLWPGPKQWLVLNALVPSRTAFILLCPKSVPAEWWYSPKLETSVGFLHAPFPADPRLTDVLRMFGPHQPPALFVGDMDPVAIAQYLAAQRMLAATGGPELAYAGMSDPWLSAMGDSSWPLARLSIRMGAPEMRLLRALESSTRLEDLVGQDGAELLRTGFKVELEAALNPAFHSPAHTRRLLSHLREIAGRTPQRRGASVLNGRRTKR